MDVGLWMGLISMVAVSFAWQRRADILHGIEMEAGLPSPLTGDEREFICNVLAGTVDSREAAPYWAG